VQQILHREQTLLVTVTSFILSTTYCKQGS